MPTRKKNRPKKGRLSKLAESPGSPQAQAASGYGMKPVVRIDGDKRTVQNVHGRDVLFHLSRIERLNGFCLGSVIAVHLNGAMKAPIRFAIPIFVNFRDTSTLRRMYRGVKPSFYKHFARHTIPVNAPNTAKNATHGIKHKEIPHVVGRIARVTVHEINFNIEVALDVVVAAVFGPFTID